MIRVNVHAASHFFGHSLTVSRQHDDLIDAVAAHLIERLLHLRADWVLDADDADELLVAGDVEEVLAEQSRIELRIIRDAVLPQEFLAADTDDASREAVKIGDFRLHAARHDGLGAFVVRRLPIVLLDVLLDGDSQRVDRVQFRRSGEQHRFLLRHTARRLDESDLRHADRQCARLVEHDRIRLGQGFNVIAALDQDAALGRSADCRRDGRRRREL